MNDSLSRRQALQTIGLGGAYLLAEPFRRGAASLCSAADPQQSGDPLTAKAKDETPAPGRPPKRIAAVVTAYYQNSHADVIVSRLLQTDTLDGQGRGYDLRLVSLYTDQVPDNDKSRALAAAHHIPVYEKARETLTLGGDRLAVDGVLLVCEHGKYPQTETDQTAYPKRRLFAELVAEMEARGQFVPVFSDKHLADNWDDAQWIYRTAKEKKIPLMAGSSLPVLWRDPAIDLPRDAKIKNLVALSYHSLDAYGFHALEMVQCLVERRHGGETGVRSVQCLEGDPVWAALEDGTVDRELFDQALARLARPPRAGKTLRELVKTPALFLIEYLDGLKAAVVTLSGAISDWTVAWRQTEPQASIAATRFSVQSARPYMHFAYLLRAIEAMMHSGHATYPVERTLLTSGVLHALMRSRKESGQRINTPHLEIAYHSQYDWRQPPLPPPDQSRQE